jgi:hypothetical protein
MVDAPSSPEEKKKKESGETLEIFDYSAMEIYRTLIAEK